MPHPVRAVVFDWAGTTVDFGSRAPARVFQAIFNSRDIAVTERQAREPMGLAKREHIQAIGNNPAVRGLWQAKFGRDFLESDVDELYREFLPLQKQVLAEHCDVIPGTIETMQYLADRGIHVGSTTGYTRELMEVVLPEAARRGYAPEVTICSDDVQFGRPKPWMLLEALKRLDAFPAWKTVKVDDTPVGIEAGRNAGTWTVAVIKTGNELGLSQSQLGEISNDELLGKLDKIRDKFLDLGADYVIDGIADLPATLEAISGRIGAGELPNAYRK